MGRIAYLYKAELLCRDCGEETVWHLRNTCKVPPHPEDETAYDSDEYPKGPYPDGGGESDTPQHCGVCGVFLENPLTYDGVAYVIDALVEYVYAHKGNPDVLDDWADHIHWYNLSEVDRANLAAYQLLRLEEM